MASRQFKEFMSEPRNIILLTEMAKAHDKKPAAKTPAVTEAITEAITEVSTAVVEQLGLAAATPDDAAKEA